VQSFELKFLGVTILQGVEFPFFLLIFEWALQQCSATALPVMLRNSYSNFSRTDYIELARSPLIVGVVHCIQQANAFDCGMFAAAFVFEWACIPVTRLLQIANLDVRYDLVPALKS